MNQTVPQYSNSEDPSREIERMAAQYGDSLLRLCCLYMGNLPAAEDAWQETFLNAFRHYPNFRHECSEKTWLTGIAVNVCRSLLRREKLRRLHFVPLPESFDDKQIPGDTASEIICDDTVLREIHRLPPKYKEVILMYYYQEMKAKEIASVLHISESAVTVRLSRAREQLKSKLQDWYDD